MRNQFLTGGASRHYIPFYSTLHAKLSSLKERQYRVQKFWLPVMYFSWKDSFFHSVLVSWEETSMHTEKASDPITCTASCDTLLHLIKRLFNKSKKCMTKDSIWHSHISVPQGHSLVERCFQYWLGCRRKNTRKIWHILCFLMLHSLKEENNFILSGKGLTREFKHLLFSHGYYFNLLYLLVFITTSSQ